MEKQRESCRQLVLVPYPFQGHINPMLQLGTILHSKGFSVIVCHTQFNFPDPSNHPNFNFLQLADDFSNNNVPFTLIGVISFFNASCSAALRESLTQIMGKEGQHDKVPCIIYDGCMYYAAEVAHDLKLPSIVFHAFCAANLQRYYAYPRLREEGHIPIQDSKLLELVPNLHPLRFKDLFIVDVENLDAFLKLIASICDIRTSSAIILNTTDCLEESSLAKLLQQCQVPIFPIGPIHKVSPPTHCSLLEEDTSCIAWLDKQTPNSVIYVSFGSISSVDKKELTEMAWGLADSKQPFLWVVPPGSIRGSQWIELLPEGFKDMVGERGCIVKWAPQKEVLAHASVGGFLSHCGWNSTLESISEGIPMICRARYGDQKVNARYLSHVWRIGLELEKHMERGEIEIAVRRLMVDREGEEMRKRAMDLKEKVEICISSGGSSYNSLNELLKLIISL